MLLDVLMLIELVSVLLLYIFILFFCTTHCTDVVVGCIIFILNLHRIMFLGFVGYCFNVSLSLSLSFSSKFKNNQKKN